MKQRRTNRAGLVAGALWATFPGMAAAARPLVAELRYEASGLLDTCPSEATFRAAVIERLKRDPFVAGAARKVIVSLTRANDGWTAVVRVEEGALPPTERRIEAQPSCAELGVGAALAVTIAIDPLVALGPLPETAAASESAEPRTRQKSATSAPTAPVRSEPLPRGAPGAAGVWLLRASPRLALGAVPGPSAGFALGGGYRATAWSLGLDAFTVLPRSKRVADSERGVRASLWGAQLGACLESSWLRACALFASGALFAAGTGVDVPLSETAWHNAVGASVGHTFRLGRLSLTPVLEGGARLHTSVLSLEREQVWATPRVLGSFGLELGYEL